MFDAILMRRSHRVRNNISTQLLLSINHKLLAESLRILRSQVALNQKNRNHFFEKKEINISQN